MHLAKSTLIFFLLSLFLSSCKNELDINADYKEIAIVYGLLDSKEGVQYIRISKNFLPETDALAAAKDAGQSLYGEELSVHLYRYEGDKVMDTYTLTPDSSIRKNEGVFYTSPHILYKLDATTNPLLADEVSQYVLKLENSKTGYIAQSKLMLIKASRGNISTPKIYYYPSSNPQVQFVTTQTNAYANPFSSEIITSKGAKTYSFTIRLYYREKNNNTGIIESKYVDWKVQEQKASSINGGEKVQFVFNGELFYVNMGQLIPVNDDVKRFADSLQFRYTAIDDNVDTYIETSKPGSGLLQEKPTFTNIKNGMGVFGARTTFSVTAYSPYPVGGTTGDLTVYSCGMNPKSADSLARGIYTKKLHFAYYRFSVATGIDTLFAP